MIMFNIVYADAIPSDLPSHIRSGWQTPNDPEKGRAASNAIIQAMLEDGWLATFDQGSEKRFREWFELERPEEVGLPGDWKRLPELVPGFQLTALLLL